MRRRAVWLQAISVAECKAIDFSSAMAQIALITGITGQDGSYLAEFLLAKGYEVHGVVRRSSTMNRGRIDHLQHANPSHPETAKFVLHYGDMTDSGGLNRLVKTVRPDEIYNLAPRVMSKSRLINRSTQGTLTVWAPPGCLRLFGQVAWRLASIR